MKRTTTWRDENDESSSEESSSSDPEEGGGAGKTIASDQSNACQHPKEKKSDVKSRKRKSVVIDFEELKQHGYKGGPSVLGVPPPKDDESRDWSWSTGKESRENKETEESYQERQKTRAAITCGEELTTALTRKEKKNISFSQKEKKKRELGQASRGKNYVEEEKRLLRDSGVYSGFDT